MYVCTYVCNRITFDSLDVKSYFLVCRDTSGDTGQVRMYEGHRVKVKVTAAKKRDIPYSDSVKLQSA